MRHHDALLEGRYQLLQPLSQGGMGSVWRARHAGLDREVAIKFMNAGLRADPEMSERFAVEARLASGLNHPNVVATTDFGFDPERGSFLVMELLEGESLRQRMSAGRLRARVACDVVEQIAWALGYVHRRGVVHCDLKPENVFLVRLDDESRRRNHVKLIDFGLAFRTTMRPTAVEGTPPYLAPERLRGLRPGPRSDLYSLGALFYELLTGRVPYQGSLLDIVDQQLRGERPPPPSSLAEEALEPRVDEVVLRALALDPAHRQRDLHAFLFELRTLMSMMGMRVRRVARAGGAAVAARLPRRVRLHERMPMALPVTVRAAGAPEREGVLQNLSSGGAFVALPAPPPAGTEVVIGVPRAGGTAVARAIVRWLLDGNGCGLEWLEAGDAVRACLGAA